MAAFLLAGTALYAQNEVVEKTFDVDDFTGIRADDAFVVTLQEDAEYKVVLEVTEEFMPYVVVNNKRGVLELSFGKLPFNLRQKARKRVARATISLPRLNYIALSGASKLSSRDVFTNSMNSFVIALKGASSIENLELKTPDLDIALDGASKAVMKLRCSDVSADLAGASKIVLSGETVDLDLKVKGASRYDGKRFDVEEAKVEASGASTVDIRVEKKLAVNLAGASKCRYYGDEDKISVKAQKVAGASSLKHSR